MLREAGFVRDRKEGTRFLLFGPSRHAGAKACELFQVSPNQSSVKSRGKKDRARLEECRSRRLPVRQNYFESVAGGLGAHSPELLR